MYCSGSTSTSGWRWALALLVALGGLLAAPAQAQDPNDAVSAVCSPPRVPDPCVDLDASKSVDSNAVGPLTYRWLMGDGTTLTGPVVSHCYAKRARYIIQLDVLVASTGEVRTAEKMLEVDFTKEPLLDFTSSVETVRVNEPVDFDASMAQNPPCTEEGVVWDFRDGFTGGGRRVTHRFNKPGRFEVRMSLRGPGPGPCGDSHCVTRTIVVTP